MALKHVTNTVGAAQAYWSENIRIQKYTVVQQLNNKTWQNA